MDDLEHCPSEQDLLGNLLDLTDVPCTPSVSNKRDAFTDALPGVGAPGLLSLCLYGWERPWTSQEPAPNSIPCPLGMQGSPLSEAQNQPVVFNSHQSNTGPPPGSDLLSGQLLLGLGFHMDLQSSPLIPPPSFTPGSSSLSHCWPGESLVHIWNLQQSLDCQVMNRLHLQRQAACQEAASWSGVLPPRHYRDPVYSTKVYVGGLPWGVTEDELINLFKPYGLVGVDWPRKDLDQPKPQGFGFLEFESHGAVCRLLKDCNKLLKPSQGSWTYYFTIHKIGTYYNEVQLVPWVISDSEYMCCSPQHLDRRVNTVFVGALHGMLSAEDLARIMNDLFGGVMCVVLKTDKHNYPIGSGRVTFSNRSSYLKAVSAASVKISTPSFTKTVQIDPWLHYTMCQMCSLQPGPFFCRELTCFKYFCHGCWCFQHSMGVLRLHLPVDWKKKQPGPAPPPATPPQDTAESEGSGVEMMMMVESEGEEAGQALETEPAPPLTEEVMEKTTMKKGKRKRCRKPKASAVPEESTAVPDSVDSPLQPPPKKKKAAAKRKEKRKRKA